MVLVVGLQDVHLQWYGLEHGSGPTTPYGPPCFWGGGGVKTGTGDQAQNTRGCARRPSICVV